jgi:hypothetical protein
MKKPISETVSPEPNLPVPNQVSLPFRLDDSFFRLPDSQHVRENNQASAATHATIISIQPPITQEPENGVILGFLRSLNSPRG